MEINNNIEETYCSFEVSKLLKERGFNQYTNTGYKEDGVIYLHQGGQEPVRNDESYYEGRTYSGKEFCCSRPTHALVIEWLRVNFHLWIDISLDQFSKPNDLRWMYSILYLSKCSYSNSSETFKTHKEATESALRHVFENKILTAEEILHKK